MAQRHWKLEKDKFRGKWSEACEQVAKGLKLTCESLIGLGDGLCKVYGCCWVGVLIRVVLQRQLPVRPLHILVAGSSLYL